MFLIIARSYTSAKPIPDGNKCLLGWDVTAALSQDDNYGNLLQVRTLTAPIDAGNNGEILKGRRICVIWDKFATEGAPRVRH